MSTRSSPISRFEAAAAVLGGLLVLATLGFLVSEVLTEQDAVGGVRVSARRVQPVEGGWLVQFEAHNLGSAALAEVRVQGRLRLASGEVQVREAQLDYLPGHSTREGGLYFTEAPRPAALELLPGGYQLP